MLKNTAITAPCLTMFFLAISLLPVRMLASSPVAHSCRLRAYVADRDSQGLNVRAMPRSKSKILGSLPNNSEVTILKTSGNWSWVTPIDPRSQRVAFRGQGWVFSSFLNTGTKGKNSETVPLHRRPSSNSKIVAGLPVGVAVTIAGCTGEWALVRRGQDQGWLSPYRQCASALTTCP
jgi:uncharacterized protein YgiM (DUF1202 family)